MSTNLFIWQLLINSEKKYPSKVAVRDNNQEVTYRSLLKKVKLAKKNLQDKISSGDVVIIYLNNSVEFVIYYFALQMLGAKVFPVYYELKEFEVSKLVQFSESKLVVTNERKIEGLSQYQVSCFNIDSYKECPVDINYQEEVLQENRNTNLGNSTHFQAYNPNDIAVLLHTSGTTSQPKIVAHSHQSIISNLKMHSDSLSLTPMDNSLIVMPLAFGYCHTSQFLTHIYLGGTITILEGLSTPEKYLNAIQGNKITVTTLVPSVLRLIMKKSDVVQKLNQSSLKKICFGGSSFSQVELTEILKTITNVDLIQTYGQTEAGPRVTAHTMRIQSPTNNVGQPISENISIKIMDKNNVEQSLGEVGNVFVDSPSLMKGYYQYGNLETSAITQHGLKTGDIGYLSKDNELYLLGRSKNIFKTSGFQVSPEEIEELIKNNFRDLTGILISGEDNQIHGKIPVLYIEGEEDKQLREEILDFCKQNLAAFKRPKKIIFVSHLERTLNGKLKR